jgi:protein gp37
VAETIWEVDDAGESEFCPCGVTLMGDPGEDDGLCSVCAAAPHGRDCYCDECEVYWHRIAEESARAAEAFNRRYVCSCGWRGASKVSPGCANCYAESIELRFKRSLKPWTPANAAENVKLWPQRMGQPYAWQAPRMIFVCSMADLFHELVPDGFIAWVFYTMALNPHHTFQVLTKRPERMRDFVTRWADNLERDDAGGLLPLDFIGARGPDAVREAHKCGRALLFADMLDQWGEPPEGAAYPTYDWLEGIGRYPSVLHNVWLGTTIENRRFVQRADLLRETSAAVRFVSAEPLLGPLVHDARQQSPLRIPGMPGVITHWSDDYAGPDLDLTSIDWLIAGGESGPKARPCREQWLRDLRDACHQTGTAYFLKQLGTRLARERGLKGKGGGDQATLDGELHHAMPSSQGALL